MFGVQRALLPPLSPRVPRRLPPVPPPSPRLQRPLAPVPQVCHRLPWPPPAAPLYFLRGPPCPPAHSHLRAPRLCNRPRCQLPSLAPHQARARRSHLLTNRPALRHRCVLLCDSV